MTEHNAAYAGFPPRVWWVLVGYGLGVAVTEATNPHSDWRIVVLGIAIAFVAVAIPMVVIVRRAWVATVAEIEHNEV